VSFRSIVHFTLRVRILVVSAESIDGKGMNHQGPTFGPNGRKAGSAPHRPGGSKNIVEGRHAGTACARRKRLSDTTTDVRCSVLLDLPGRLS
jgi:hypothetical protein